MKNEWKKFRFSLKSSFYIALVVWVVFTAVFYFLKIPVLLVIPAAFSVFIFSFYIIQYRLEKYIYTRVKKIYDDVNMLDASNFLPKHVTTDMESLTREVEKFAEDKKLEIEALKLRESYRKEFMGNIAHELKTPLFTVQGYILTLLDGAMKDKKVRKKYLQRASKGVDRLVYIVKDLDMITKFETGNIALNIEQMNIIELIQNVFDLLEMKAAKKGILLTFDKNYTQSIFVNADRERIQQVVTNLVVNSIKYGRENGTTQVSVEPITKTKMIVRVKDNGEGIHKKNLSRIFERFYRVDSSGSRKEGGSGLGLSIVKHILEAHKQRIYVDSEIGEGSEFSFTLEKSKV